ncbi:MAG: glycerol-3-phosphate 1-O-acyltransferase PlsY [Dehalococcoidia bacterium]
MIDIAYYLVSGVVGYLFGSLAFGVWIVNFSTGRDVRSQGSKKTGMTNVVRIAGLKIGAIVLVLDLVKCIVAVLIARILFENYFAESIAAIFAVVGHCWPVFAKFSGGRGTASGLGALLFLSPVSGLVVILVGIILIAFTRYVSLASIVGSILGIVMMLVMVVFTNQPFEHLIYAVVVSLLILFMHKENMQRLIKGTERKIGNTQS